MRADNRIIEYTSCVLILLCVISGCNSSPDPVDYPKSQRHSIAIDGNIEFSGHVVWNAQSDSLSASVWATNKGEQDATLEFGACSFLILGYAVKENERILVWHNELKENYICLHELIRIALNPGETVELESLGNVKGKIWAQDLPENITEFEIVAYQEEGLPIKAILSSERL